MNLDILTLNLWNVTEPLKERYSALAKGLTSLQPDIVCLQESASWDPKSGRGQSEIVAGFCNLQHGVEMNSLSILSRYPIARSDRVALPVFSEDAPRHVLLAEILLDQRAISVANTHLAYKPEISQERKSQVATVLAAIKHFKSTSTKEIGAKILCGDFNDDPDSPAVRLVLESGDGFFDAYGRCHPDRPGSTYSRTNPYFDPTYTADQRVDYIFATANLVPKECSVVFDGSGGCGFVSDHFGVFLRSEFSFK